MNAPEPTPNQKPRFTWDDPLRLDAQLGEDERMVRDAAARYAADKLAPRVLEAFRTEHTDPSIFREMGALGLLGPTDRIRETKFIHLAIVIDEYGATEGMIALHDLVENILGELPERYEDFETTCI